MSSFRGMELLTRPSLRVLVLTCVGLVAVGLPQPVRATGEASLSFQPEAVAVRVGEVFQTKVMIDTAGEKAGGAGARILYDPAYLEAVKVEPGGVFADYPLAGFDNVSGLVSVSGVVSSRDMLFTGTGVLATVTWKALAPGTERVSFEFTPGKTNDSNIAVMYGSGDALSSVGNLTVAIDPGGGGSDTAATPLSTGQENGGGRGGPNETSGTGTDTTATSITLPAWLETILVKVGLINQPASSATDSRQTPPATTAADSNLEELATEVDPYQPLERQPAIEEVYRVQEPVTGSDIASSKRGNDSWRLVLLVILLLAAGLTGWKMFGRKRVKLSRRELKPAGEPGSTPNDVEAEE